MLAGQVRAGLTRAQAAGFMVLVADMAATAYSTWKECRRCCEPAARLQIPSQS